MDVEHQLRRLLEAGFEFQTFERFPNAVGVLRGGAIALLHPTPEGLRLIGAPGWRMGEVMGVLVETDGRKAFRYKAQEVEATEDRLAELRRFQRDLEDALAGRI